MTKPQVIEPQTPVPGSLPVIYQDDDMIVIDKPGGFHVHQPERPNRRVPREIVILHLLGRQTGQWLYPVHRIDVATSGLLLMALNKETASVMGSLFRDSLVEKQYSAIVRGYTPDEGVIDVPLALDSTGEMVEAVTEFKTLSRTELPHAVGKRHASARYSLIEARPRTGRFHQIRRHMARLSHPIVGCTSHGDSHHNRFFRETLDLRGLWLRADRLRFTDPRSGREFDFQAPTTQAWHTAIDRLCFSQSPVG